MYVLLWGVATKAEAIYNNIKSSCTIKKRICSIGIDNSSFLPYLNTTNGTSC